MKTCTQSRDAELFCSDFSNTTILQDKNQESQSSDYNRDRFEVVTCSDNDFSSNIDISLLAFLKLHEQLNEKMRQKIRLTIVATSSVLGFIQPLINTMNLGKNTKIVNISHQEEVNKVCNKAHLLLSPTKTNQIEFIKKALRKGIPIICFDNYWTQNLINDKCGFKIPFNHLSYCNNIDAFSAYTYTLFTNSFLLDSLSKGAKERYTELFEAD